MAFYASLINHYRPMYYKGHVVVSVIVVWGAAVTVKRTRWLHVGEPQTLLQEYLSVFTSRVPRIIYPKPAFVLALCLTATVSFICQVSKTS